MFITLNGKKLAVILLVTIFSLTSFFLVVKGESRAASSSNSWGLKYNGAGELPDGNATSEYLKTFNAYFLGNTSEKKVYLTFDAGYEAGYTKNILEVLKNTGVKATFFVVGTYIRDNADLVKQMVADGHIVGNHTEHHPNMSKMSTMENFKNEINPVEEKYKEVVGEEMKKYYRPPQGVFSEKNLEMAKELGYKTIFWSIAYVDWYKDRQPSHDDALSTLTSRLHPGAIILLHSTSKTNSEILSDFIAKVRDLGYSFGTLDELN